MQRSSAHDSISAVTVCRRCREEQAWTIEAVAANTSHVVPIWTTQGLTIMSRPCFPLVAKSLLSRVQSNFRHARKLYHSIGSLLPVVYFCDSDNEVQNRLNHPQHLNGPIPHQLQEMLHEANSYIQSFRAAVEVNAQQTCRLLFMVIKSWSPL